MHLRLQSAGVPKIPWTRTRLCAFGARNDKLGLDTNARSSYNLATTKFRVAYDKENDARVCQRRLFESDLRFARGRRRGHHERTCRRDARLGGVDDEHDEKTRRAQTGAAFAVYGVELTPSGEKIALEVVRHHRLIESFLHEALGIPWDEVHVEAHKLEHVLSDNLEDHIADFLGNPTEDPHGDPIPTKAGSIVASDQQSLADLAPGARATIRRIGAQDPERLRYLRGLGLIPKANVHLIDHAPFQGPVRVRVVDGGEHSIDRSLAQQIWVSSSKRQRKVEQAAQSGAAIIK